MKPRSIKNKYISPRKGLRTAALLISFVLLWGALAATCTADSMQLYSKRYDEPIVLPYKGEHTFSHQSSDMCSETLTFHSPAMSIVTICYTKGKAASDSLPDSTLTVSVYTDTAQLICEKKAGEGEVTLLQFIPSYTGTYHVVLTDRSSAAGSYTASVEISASTGYSQNRLDSFPHRAEYTERSHQTNKVTKLYPKTMYPSTDYLVSVFEIVHTAGSVLSYKINTPDLSDVYAVLYTDCGNYRAPHISHASDTYMAGDACEVSYSTSSYLFVYSKGDFSLEANLLEHLEYKTEPLSLPYCAKITLSDAEPMYDQESLNTLIGEFPFSDIKNRNVKFFTLATEQSSVVTLLCQRKEHKYFSLVSDQNGLSPQSVHPLRQYASYCSELEPAELCYNAVITDSPNLYLCYTGTLSESEIELFSSPTHRTITTFEEEYSKDSPIPQVVINSLYSDRDIYQRLGVEQNAADITKVSGFMLESADGHRHYYSGTGTITPPAQGGSYKLYAQINCSYKNDDGSSFEKYHSFFVAQLNIKSILSLPSVDDLIQAIEGRNPTPFLVLVAFILLAVGVVVAAKKLLAKYMLTSNAPENENKKEDQIEKHNESSERQPENTHKRG